MRDLLLAEGDGAWLVREATALERLLGHAGAGAGTDEDAGTDA
ncbi:hypothetical protein [Actinomadura sp. 9N407]